MNYQTEINCANPRPICSALCMYMYVCAYTRPARTVHRIYMCILLTTCHLEERLPSHTTVSKLRLNAKKDKKKRKGKEI